MRVRVGRLALSIIARRRLRSETRDGWMVASADVYFALRCPSHASSALDLLEHEVERRKRERNTHTGSSPRASRFTKSARERSSMKNKQSGARTDRIIAAETCQGGKRD
jgi:hypothetical protein